MGVRVPLGWGCQGEVEKYSCLPMLPRMHPACMDSNRVRDVADVVRALSDGVPPLNFYSFRKGNEEVVQTDMYPPLHHPQTVNFFSFACLQQHGFWYGDQHGYHAPLYAQFGGKPVKGSDALWRMCMQAFVRDPEQYTPARLAAITPEELSRILADERGPVPFPDFEARLRLTRAYGEHSVDRDGVEAILLRANVAQDSLLTFVEELQYLPGYQDQFRKKSLLLAMALANRPEHFLTVRDPEHWRPIIDYHLMRLALRTGMVRVFDSAFRATLAARFWVSDPAAEEQIRRATSEAVQEVVSISGKPMDVVDHLFWRARRYCPEMEEPQCEKCVLKDACEKNRELFQPVFRTTNY